MEFDPSAMSPVMHELMEGIEANVELMHQHGHTRAADRVVRKVERLRRRAARVNDHLRSSLEPRAPGRNAG